MAKKLRVGVLFGGGAIDRKKYEVVPIGISKAGQWLGGAQADALLGTPSAPRISTRAANKRGVVSIDAASTSEAENSSALALGGSATGTSAAGLDVVFPVLHGTFGEDGTIQGMLELANVAYVGSGVLGSAAGMDKDAMKKMFAAAGLPLVRHVTLLRSEWKAGSKKCMERIEEELRYPVFVKPANLGSSVGISKVHDHGELAPALDLAAGFDRKIVIEEGVTGSGKLKGKGKARELEVAVLGNDTPIASVVGEIVPDREFYDYESKYDSSSTSQPIIPASLSREQAKQIRAMAIAAFKACDCSGLARVDFLLQAADPKSSKPPKIYLNEINTMPGFTSISMYPKLLEASGIGYSDLIDRLIALAVERHAERKQTTFSR